MSSQRMLLAGLLLVLAACGSPTSPNVSETKLPGDGPSDGPGAHFQPLGPICPKMASQLCAPTSGHN